MDVNTGRNRTFENLIESGINLTKVVRIENSNYTYSYFGKTGDFTRGNTERNKAGRRGCVQCT